MGMPNMKGAMTVGELRRAMDMVADDVKIVVEAPDTEGIPGYMPYIIDGADMHEAFFVISVDDSDYARGEGGEVLEY